jgi:Fur family ferric uptake transcriptional regulator
MNSLAIEWDSRLQQIGCRLTAPRQAVIATLSQAEHPLSPFEVFDQARRLYHHRLGLVTVYRTLERLESLALIRRVFVPGKGLAYLPAHQDVDVLLLCQVCGHTKQVRDQTLELFIQYLGQKLGYQVAHQPVEITGTCSECQHTLALSGDSQ